MTFRRRLAEWIYPEVFLRLKETKEAMEHNATESYRRVDYYGNAYINSTKLLSEARARITALENDFKSVNDAWHHIFNENQICEFRVGSMEKEIEALRAQLAAEREKPRLEWVEANWECPQAKCNSVHLGYMPDFDFTLYRPHPEFSLAANKITHFARIPLPVGIKTDKEKENV